MKAKRCSNKACRRIEQLLLLSEFGKNKGMEDGYDYYCKKCRKTANKKQYEKNKDKPEFKARHDARNKKFHEENLDYIPPYIIEKPDYKKKYYKENIVYWQERYQQQIKENLNYNKQRRQKQLARHPNYFNKYMKNKRETDPNFDMLCVLRARLDSALNGTAKADTTLNLLGCTLDYLWIYFEKLYTRGMTREDHGKGPGKWNVDHIRPCSSFDLTDPEQQKKCFHYTNLQPLWEEDNLRKGSRI